MIEKDINEEKNPFFHSLMIMNDDDDGKDGAVTTESTEDVFCGFSCSWSHMAHYRYRIILFHYFRIIIQERRQNVSDLNLLVAKLDPHTWNFAHLPLKILRLKQVSGARSELYDYIKPSISCVFVCGWMEYYTPRGGGASEFLSSVKQKEEEEKNNSCKRRLGCLLTEDDNDAASV